MQQSKGRRAIGQTFDECVAGRDSFVRWIDEEDASVSTRTTGTIPQASFASPGKLANRASQWGRIGASLVAHDQFEDVDGRVICSGAAVSSPAMPNALRGLILDYGQVLTYAQPSTVVTTMAQRAKVEERLFVDAYWKHRREYDLGLSSPKYWARVLDTCGIAAVAGEAGDAATVEALIDADAQSWLTFRESMWDLAGVFRGVGGKTAILSNGVDAVMSRLRTQRPLERWFDVVIVSCELGVAKPSLEIYEATLARMGTQAHETLFVDDRIENVEAARELGLHAVLFRGDEDVDAVREQLGVDLASECSIRSHSPTSAAGPANRAASIEPANVLQTE
jgi:putative hydrolase of the HAD superfamily